MGTSATIGLAVHPLVIPAFLGWCVLVATLGLLGRARRRREGRGGSTLPAVGFWIAVGGLLALTLTPSVSGLLWPEVDKHRFCDWTPPRTGFGLFAPDRERRWNVLLCVPLGATAAAYGASLVRQRRSWWIVAAPLALSLTLPELVETGQRYLPLGRVCALVDAVDNVSGVLLGATVAATALVAVARRPARRSSDRRVSIR